MTESLNEVAYPPARTARVTLWIIFLAISILSFAITLADEYAHKGIVVAYLVPPITTASSAGDVVTRFGECDPSSYIKEADILLSGKDPRKDVYIKIWAPGFPVMEAFALGLSHNHFVRNMFLITAAVWSLSLGLCGAALVRLSGSILFPFLLLLVLATHLFNDYLLNEGIVYSETIGIALFMPLMILFCASWAGNKLCLTTCAALGLMFVGFLRSQFLLIVEVTFTAATLYAFVVWILYRGRRGTGRLRVGPVLISTLLLLVAVNVYARWNDGEFVHNEYFYRLPWRVQSPPDMFDTGGMGVLCQADGKTCDRMRMQNAHDDARMKTLSDTTSAQRQNWTDNKRAVIHTLLTRPFRVLSMKSHYFIRYFFSEPLSVPDQNMGFTYLYLENALFAIFGLLGLAGCVAFRRFPFFQALGLFFLVGWFGSCIVNFTVLHFEVRYLFFGKVLNCFVFAVVLAHVCRMSMVWPNVQRKLDSIDGVDVALV